MVMLNSSEYKSVKFPVADIFPCPEEEMVTSWKDRFTPARVMKQFREAKAAGAEADFYREMMLEVVNDDLRIFESEWFKRYQYKEFKSQLGKCNVFTSLDLAVSKKQSGDFTVIITIAVNEEGHWFIVKCDVGRFNPSETMDKLFEHVTMFKPLEVRAEKAALQQVLDHFIDQRMMDTGVYFNYTPLENNSVISKELRIVALQPKMRMKHIHFPTDIDQDGIAELEYEMMGYIKTGPTTAHDDCVDCLGNFLDPDFIVVPNAKSGTEVEGDMYDFDNMGDEAYDDYGY